ncbi:MAG TPA: DoxX family protein [Geobacterales bacterium]|nr:DoxX family protein [Geobacterales bacterium]
MHPFMSRFNAQCYALMRIVAGFLFLWHGAEKLLGYPAPLPAGVPPFIIYIAGPIELFGGTLIMLGLLTRHAAFLASGLMAFAYWMGHGTKAVLPIVNQGELAVLYCFVFLFIASQGGGIWSLDSAQKRQ